MAANVFTRRFESRRCNNGFTEKTQKRAGPNQASVKQTVDIARNVSRLDPESVLRKHVNVRNTHILPRLILRERAVGQDPNAQSRDKKW